MPSEDDLRKLAAEYFQKASERQMHGEHDEDIALYTQSIEATPRPKPIPSAAGPISSSATTSAQSRNAWIKVDPDFGNPYNDIGASLIEQDN